jgi:protein-tyrosine phosphatase
LPDEKTFPCSNQLIEIDFSSCSTKVVCKDEQAEQYLKIQRLFRNINKTEKDFNSRVLVHCAMGMSRSATSVIMFIMKEFLIPLEDAFEFVKTQRDATDPNEGFMLQLKKFEEDGFVFL